ncbi:metalloregulator ArsR/SmtB family transcription factor [bacterium]|nr:metalloregulator ArsR/SmtB family transcription factor [bacterium]
MPGLQEVFHELADPTRLRVLGAILAGRKNVTQIVAELDLTQPQVSYHLKKLKDAGLAVEERRGRWVYYDANRRTSDERVRSLLTLLEGWFAGVPVSAAPEQAGPVRRPAASPDRERDELEDFLL